MKTAVSTAMLSFLLISIILGGIGLIFCKQIMVLLNTPDDTLDMAVIYLRIYFLGLPFLFMYNVISSMFNAFGKSKTPLLFLIFSSILNVVLDLFMVATLNMGVAGAAWATLISQGIAAVSSSFVLKKFLMKFPSEKKSTFSKAEFFSMLRIALPSILQQSIVSIGMMLVQSVINSFGSSALAGFSAAMFAKCPAGRPGTADEIANLAELLMSEKGAFITGATFLADGGATASYYYGPLQPDQN